MRWRSRLFACLCSVLGVVACGGGGAGGAVGGLLLLIFVGPSNGSFYIDDDGALGVQLRLCEDEGGSEVACTINIQAIDPSNPSSLDPWSNFYKVSFEIRATSNVAGCNSIRGTIEEDELTLEGCFKGKFTNVNEVVADDGRRLLFNLKPDLRTGVWVDIDKPTRRYVFVADNGSTAIGCEKDGLSIAPARVTYTNSDVLNGILTSVDTLEVDRIGAAPEQWSAKMVGVSGLKLERAATASSEADTRALLRRDEDEDCS